MVRIEVGRHVGETPDSECVLSKHNRYAHIPGLTSKGPEH